MVFVKGGGQAPAKKKKAKPEPKKETKTEINEDVVSMSRADLDQLISKKVESEVAEKTRGGMRAIVVGGKQACPEIPRKDVEAYLNSESSPTKVFCMSKGGFNFQVIGTDSLAYYDSDQDLRVRPNAIFVDLRKGNFGSGIGTQFFPRARGVEVMAIQEIRDLMDRKKLLGKDAGKEIPKFMSVDGIHKLLKKSPSYNPNHKGSDHYKFLFEAEYKEILKCEYEQYWATQEIREKHRLKLSKRSDKEIMLGQVE